MTTDTPTRKSAKPGPTQPTEPAARVRTITPALARDWLDPEKNRHNRSLTQAHIDGLARDMSAGVWQLTGEAIKWEGDPDAGGALLLDGQHRLEAVAYSGVTIQSFVVTGIDRQAQEVMDTNLRRSAKNALELEDLPDPAALAALARMVLLWDQGAYKATDYRGAKSPTNTEIIQWAKDHPKAADAIWIGKKYVITGLAYAARVFAVYKLLQVANADDVGDFMHSIAQSKGLGGEGDPRLAVIDRLRYAERRKERIPRWVQANMIFRAWNNYQRGTSVHSMLLTEGGSGPNRGKWVRPETSLVSPGSVVWTDAEEEDAAFRRDVLPAR